MTDNELKFYDPETGAELHRVPEGATIPAGMPCGQPIDGMGWRWYAKGLVRDTVQRDLPPRFTREPITPPKPPLPTEPGFYTDKDGDLWKLRDDGMWELVDGCIYPRESVASYAPFVPVTLVPTETWDRLRVLDPEDTRDRVDANGGVWRYGEGRNCWVRRGDGTFLYGLEVVDRHYGPLRFADEVSDR